MATKNIAVDATLQAMLVVRNSIKVKCQKSLTVALAQAFPGVGEQVSQETLLVMRMRLAKEASEGLEGRHFGGREGVTVSEKQSRRNFKGRSKQVLEIGTRAKPWALQKKKKDRFKRNTRRDDAVL